METKEKLIKELNYRIARMTNDIDCHLQSIEENLKNIEDMKQMNMQYAKEIAEMNAIIKLLEANV